MVLTDTAIRKSKPSSKPYKLTDGRGLFLLVQPTGAKLWHCKYSFGGKERLMALGRYPDVPLGEARHRHQAARGMLASGIDPMAERRAEKTAERASTEGSFQAVAALWLAQWREGKSQRHVGYVERRMQTDIFPHLGARPIAFPEAPEVVDLMKAIQGRGATDLAKRARETVSQIFRFALANRFTKSNPAAAIKPSDILKSTTKKNYARVDARELATLMRSIEVYQGTHVTRLAMQLMAHTFTRTGELIGARWAEFDLEAARWDIPGGRMKMKTPHIVSLSPQTIQIIRTLNHLTGHGEFLFPGDRDPKKHMSNITILKGLQRMGFQGKMTGHGFRGLASTILHENGFDEAIIEAQLAHQKRNRVAASYNHAKYLRQRREMMEWWSNHLEQVQRGDNVVSIRTVA